MAALVLSFLFSVAHFALATAKRKKMLKPNMNKAVPITSFLGMLCTIAIVAGTIVLSYIWELTCGPGFGFAVVCLLLQALGTFLSSPRLQGACRKCCLMCCAVADAWRDTVGGGTVGDGAICGDSISSDAVVVEEGREHLKINVINGVYSDVAALAAAPAGGAAHVREGGLANPEYVPEALRHVSAGESVDAKSSRVAINANAACESKVSRMVADLEAAKNAAVAREDFQEAARLKGELVAARAEASAQQAKQAVLDQQSKSALDAGEESLRVAKQALSAEKAVLKEDDCTKVAELKNVAGADLARRLASATDAVATKEENLAAAMC